MNHIVNIKVKNRVAVWDDTSSEIICDNRDYTVTVDFDDEWSEIETKTARVYESGQYTDIVFTGNSFTAPPVHDTLIALIGIFSGDITTTPAIVPCKKSILSNGGEIADPPDDVYKQIIDMIESGMLKGEPGYAPTVSVTDITGGHRVTITDAKGEKSFDVMDGKGGEGGGNAIIDVAVLPESDIDENAFYRAVQAEFYQSDAPLPNYKCIVVEVLPDIGENVTNSDLSKFCYYYCHSDGGVYGYISADLGAASGVPEGWYPADVLFGAIGVGFNGVVDSLEGLPTPEWVSLYIQYKLHINTAGKWEAIDSIGARGEGRLAEVFNSSNNVAFGDYSHAEGRDTEASDTCSHAEGSNTHAEGYCSHAEGSNTHAEGYFSHAEGYDTHAEGCDSHAEGSNTHAEGDDSHAEGFNTHAAGRCQHVQGRLNIVDPEYDPLNGNGYGKYAHIVGNGTASNCSNAHTLDWSGVAWFQGRPQFGGTAQDDGAQTVMANGDTEIILKSPNGTSFKITVSDSGELTATAI